MSHYNVKFTGSKADKEAQALKACVDYMGKVRFNRVTLEIAQSLKGLSAKTTYRSVCFYCDFMGIKGYWPVRAMFKHIWTLS